MPASQTHPFTHLNILLPAMVLLAFSLLSSPAGAVDKPVTKRLRMDECFHVWVSPANEACDEAKWMIFSQDNRFEASPDTCAALIAYYRGKDAKFTKNGLILFSNSHSIPDEKDETKTMSPFLLKLYRLKAWRDAENKLVEALVTEANKEGVPVWINTTRYVGNRVATFQLLTDPKLTLKK
jgi:hypothetical protein